MTETRSSDSIRVRSGDLTAGEVLEKLEDGHRVVIEVDLGVTTTELCLRKDGDEYYCDTPVKLLTHEDREAMKRCLERLGIVDAE